MTAADRPQRAFDLACVQLNPRREPAANIEAAVRMGMDAAAMGAKLICLPEYVGGLYPKRDMLANAYGEAEHPALRALGEAARLSRSWWIAGSILVREGEGVFNRCYVFDESGQRVAHYDKIHLFDAVLPSGRSIRESDTYASGGEAVVVDAPWGRIGLALCYDLRFPQLFRAMAQAGAELFVVPSAFTAQTGALHWETLVRTRAIENACWMAAPATTGEHPGGHSTFGHTLIIDPRGRVVAEGDEAEGVVSAPVDLDAVAPARAAIPSYALDKPFTVNVRSRAR